MNPTSNHNYSVPLIDLSFVVYLMNPTSNHNCKEVFFYLLLVVYLMNPTSNHNRPCFRLQNLRLYIL